MHIGYWWERQMERDYREDQDGGGWTILKWILEIGWGGMVGNDLAQDRDQWRALVNTVMNFRVPYNARKFLSSCTTGSFSKTQLHE
jgi:hypothetical protein